VTNTSKAPFDRSLQTPATRAVVDRPYAEDFTFFGYSYRRRGPDRRARRLARFVP
jgi:hypothetical protein